MAEAQEEGKQAFLRELDKLRREGNNSDMDATADKDNPSAISLQPSALG